MLAPARIQSAIELLESLLNQWKEGRHTPADRLLDTYFRKRRYIGSKDRAFIAEIFYWVLRHKASLEWWGNHYGLPLNARTLTLTALSFRKEENIPSLFSGEKYAPALLSALEKDFIVQLTHKELMHPDMPQNARVNTPAWLFAYLERTFKDNTEAELLAMNSQAAIDIRTNTLKIQREQLLNDLKQQGLEATTSPLSPWGIRLGGRAAIFSLDAFKQGQFEMQDAGSQMIAFLADAKPGQKVIDFCAGAGGKTLAMAASMQNKGRILAWDTSAARLEQIKPRLRRAGVDNVQLHVITSEQDAYIKRHKDSADCVLVDVPCSGTGTWRRNPDLKWRFSEQDLNELLEVQRRILVSAARLVKPGGRLIYATCSLLSCENEDQIEAFLNSSNTFSVVLTFEIWDKNPPSNAVPNTPFLRLTPHQDGVDGFFAAVLKRNGGLPEQA